MLIIRPYNRSYCTAGSRILMWRTPLVLRRTWLGKFQQFAIADNVIVMCNRHNLLSFLDVLAGLHWLGRTLLEEDPRETWRRRDRDMEECRDRSVRAEPMNNCWIFRIILVTLSSSIIIIIISPSSTTHWQDEGTLSLSTPITWCKHI